jgi:hypothetical protein
MKTTLTAKTIHGLTTQYINTLNLVEGGGLRKDYITRVLFMLQDIELSKAIKAINTIIKELKETDKANGSRYNRNVIALFGRLKKKGVDKSIEELTQTDLKALKYDELINLFKVKKEQPEAEEKPVPTAPTPAAEVVVDVSEETSSVRDEIINNAHDIATATAEELIDTYLATLNEFEEFAQNFDPSKSANQTAMVIALLQKAMA